MKIRVRYNVKVKEEELYWQGEVRTINIATNGITFLQKLGKLIWHVGEKHGEMN